MKAQTSVPLSAEGVKMMFQRKKGSGKAQTAKAVASVPLFRLTAHTSLKTPSFTSSLHVTNVKTGLFMIDANHMDARLDVLSLRYIGAWA